MRWKAWKCLAVEVDSLIAGDGVASFLNKVALFEGLPKEIFADNRPEITSNAMNEWTYNKNDHHVFIDPTVLHKMVLLKALIVN